MKFFSNAVDLVRRRGSSSKANRALPEVTELVPSGTVDADVDAAVRRFFAEAAAQQAAAPSSYSNVTEEARAAHQAKMDFLSSCVAHLGSLSKRHLAAVPIVMSEVLTYLSEDHTSKRKIIQKFGNQSAFIKLDGSSIAKLQDIFLAHTKTPAMAVDVFHMIVGVWVPLLIKAENLKAANTALANVRKFCGDDVDYSIAFIDAGFGSFDPVFKASPATAQKLVVDLSRVALRHHRSKVEFIKASFNTITNLVAAEAQTNDPVVKYLINETGDAICECAVKIAAHKLELQAAFDEVSAYNKAARAAGTPLGSQNLSKLERVYRDKRDLEDHVIENAFLIIVRNAGESPELAQSLLTSMVRICAEDDVPLNGDRGHRHTFVENAVKAFGTIMMRNGRLADAVKGRITDFAGVAAELFDQHSFSHEGQPFYIQAPITGREPSLYIVRDPETEANSGWQPLMPNALNAPEMNAPGEKSTMVSAQGADRFDALTAQIRAKPQKRPNAHLAVTCIYDNVRLGAAQFLAAVKKSEGGETPTLAYYADGIDIAKQVLAEPSHESWLTAAPKLIHNAQDTSKQRWMGAQPS